jgi:hypothetical protein
VPTRTDKSLFGSFSSEKERKDSSSFLSKKDFCPFAASAEGAP